MGGGLSIISRCLIYKIQFPKSLTCSIFQPYPAWLSYTMRPKQYFKSSFYNFFEKETRKAGLDQQIRKAGLDQKGWTGSADDQSQVRHNQPTALSCLPPFPAAKQAFGESRKGFNSKQQTHATHLLECIGWACMITAQAVAAMMPPHHMIPSHTTANHYPGFIALDSVNKTFTESLSIQY